ncbi:hypothetical protein ABT127_30535 [Streptomyces sp. NPDC001904]|uniref:hypothetical protein n=1 Tax=Streptomyces sp. NPDC001904 TaxID=3154531 RepID=UPI003330B084
MVQDVTPPGAGVGVCLPIDASAGTGAAPTRLYAQTPARRTRQLVADLIAATVTAAPTVRQAILTPAEPGRKAQSAGDSLASSLDRAGDAAPKVPLVGNSLKAPLKSAADSGTALSDAGQSLQDTVGHVATLTTLALILLPTALIVVVWLVPRLLWMRRTATTRRLLSTPAARTCWPCAHSPAHSAR